MLGCVSSAGLAKLSGGYAVSALRSVYLRDRLVHWVTLTDKVVCTRRLVYIGTSEHAMPETKDMVNCIPCIVGRSSVWVTWVQALGK